MLSLGYVFTKGKQVPHFLKYTKILVEIKLGAWLELMPSLRVCNAGEPVFCHPMSHKSKLTIGYFTEAAHSRKLKEIFLALSQRNSEANVSNLG